MRLLLENESDVSKREKNYGYILKAELFVTASESNICSSISI